MLVTPVPPQSDLLISLGLISQSADPVREIETSPALPTPTRSRRWPRSASTGFRRPTAPPRTLLGHVSAEPVADCNIVAVTATASTPERRRQDRERLRRLDDRLPDRSASRPGRHRRARDSTRQLNDRTADSSQHREPALPAEATRSRARIQPFRPRPPRSRPARRRHRSRCSASRAACSSDWCSGSAARSPTRRSTRGSVARSSFGPRFRLPILARIPKESRAQRNAPISPDSLSPGAIEAYGRFAPRSGRVGAATGGSRAVLITSPSASEGKTTTAINLAASLSLAGRKVILIDGDLRKPEIGPSLGVRELHGAWSRAARRGEPR